jgi:hypothetical protein
MLLGAMNPAMVHLVIDVPLKVQLKEKHLAARVDYRWSDPAFPHLHQHFHARAK